MDDAYLAEKISLRWAPKPGPDTRRPVLQSHWLAGPTSSGPQGVKNHERLPLNLII